MRFFHLITVFLFVLSSPVHAAEDWGRNGHRATAEIAEQYLSNRAMKKIRKLLGGESLAVISTFGDEIKSDERYRKYGPWHYVNFPFGSRYESHPKSDRGDLIMGIDKCISVLKDENSTSDEKSFHLKMLVHFIGDLHQPLHVGMAKDKGGNDFQVLWFDVGTNLHTVWDTKMLESYNMSFSELATNSNILSETQLKQIRQGTTMDWMYESRELCEDIYSNTKVGENLGYNYMYRYVHVMRRQLQKGGIRLAHVLNEIFD